MRSWEQCWVPLQHKAPKQQGCSLSTAGCSQAAPRLKHSSSEDHNEALPCHQHGSLTAAFPDCISAPPSLFPNLQPVVSKLAVFLFLLLSQQSSCKFSGFDCLTLPTSSRGHNKHSISVTLYPAKEHAWG